MKQRILGKDLVVSSIGLGCMGMSHAYGAPRDKAAMKELIARAVDLGYTLFDTAEVYGTPEAPHDNELLVGEALKPYRNRVVMASKFGIQFQQVSGVNKELRPDARPETIRASVEGSLKRLQTDHIDIYYQHRQDPNVPVEEVAGVMQDLIREGKILHWGLSEVDEDVIRRAHAVCPVTAVQNRYSMMARWYENLFPVLEALHIGFVAFSPMANGFLSGKYSADSTFDARTDMRSIMPQFKKESYARNKTLLDILATAARLKGATLSQISLAWMLHKKPWIVPIPGTTRPDRLAENAGAADVDFTDEEFRELEEALARTPMSMVFGGTATKKE
jgi:aryl-alcohol dehydrogenase-like predicted oxidoreductase